MKKGLLIVLLAAVIAVFSGCSGLMGTLADMTPGRIIIQGKLLEPVYMMTVSGGKVTINDIQVYNASGKKKGNKLAEMYKNNIDNIVNKEGRLAIIYIEGKRTGNIKTDEVKIFKEIKNVLASGKSKKDKKKELISITRDEYLTSLIIDSN